MSFAAKGEWNWKDDRVVVFGASALCSLQSVSRFSHLFLCRPWIEHVYYFQIEYKAMIEAIEW